MGRDYGEAVMVGTFAPCRRNNDFVIPIFESRESNRPLMQLGGDDETVAGFMECTVPFIPFTDGPVSAAGQPFIYAFQIAHDAILAGPRAQLAERLAPLVDDGTLAHLPVTRAEVADFCGMTNRLKDLFPAAFDYLEHTGSTETAWRWKIHSTITPGLRAAVAARLRKLGESDAAVERLCRSIRVRRHDDGIRAIIDVRPGIAGNPVEVLERQLADPALFGAAATYWPDLEGVRPEFRCNAPTEKKRLGSLDITLHEICVTPAWAAWIAATLAGTGHRVSEGITGGDVLMLVFGMESMGRKDFKLFEESEAKHPRVRAVRVWGSAQKFPKIPGLSELTEFQAEQLLIALVGGMPPGHVFTPPPDRPPYPGTVVIDNLPPRNPRCISNDVIESIGGRRPMPGRVAARVTEIIGWPGSGKTQAALEAAHRIWSQFQIVWWIDALDERTVWHDMAALYDRLGLPDPSELDSVTKAQAVDDWLVERGIALLVFDGADVKLLPPLRCLHEGDNVILVTPRNRATDLSPDAILLTSDWTKEQTAALLRAHRLPEQWADELTTAYGGLAAGLVSAVEIMAERKIGLKKFLRSCNQNKELLMIPPSGYPLPPLELWGHQYRSLPLEQQAVMNLLAVMAPMPVDARVLAHRDPGVYHGSINVSDDGIWLSRPVQMGIRLAMGRPSVIESARTAIRLLSRAYVIAENDPATWKAAAPLLDHVLAAIAWDVDWAADHHPDLVAGALIVAAQTGAGSRVRKLMMKLRRVTHPLIRRALGLAWLTAGDAVLAAHHYIASIEIGGWSAAATLGQTMALLAMTDEQRGANPMDIVYSGLDEDGKAIATAMLLEFDPKVDEGELTRLDRRLTSIALSPYIAAAFRAVAYAWLRAGDSALATRLCLKAGAAAKLTFGPDHPELFANELLDIEIRRNVRLLDFEADGRRLLGRARRQLGTQHYLTRRIEQVLAQ